MFDSNDIVDCLENLGVVPGDLLYMHVDFGHMECFRGTPVDLRDALREMVGEEGTLVVPAYPDRASLLIEYMSRNPVLDVRRTPTKMGIFQEIFRRTSGAFRSLHPWATTCALGRDAERLLNEHHLHPDPFSPSSPYLKLREKHGKIIGIGTDINISSYVHVMDSLLQDHYPFHVYIDPPVNARVIDWNGKEIHAQALMIRQEIATCIYPMELKPYLLEKSVLNEDTREGSKFYVMNIPEYIGTATEVAQEQMSRGEPPCWLRKFCEKYDVDFSLRRPDSD